jgi:methionyl-tRNA formyltransferase
MKIAKLFRIFRKSRKFVFFGTGEFSCIVLDKLIENNLRPDLVVTAPDKLAGRKKILTPPPLKLTAGNLPRSRTPKENKFATGQVSSLRGRQLTTIQPESLKNNLELIKIITELKPDFGIVAAYGKIIPKPVLDLFLKGILNLHPSLLPKYRGPSPIQTAILNGDKKTGVSIMLLDEEMDHGPILAQKEVSINPDEYFSSLYRKLALLGAEALLEAIPMWLSNKIVPKPQNHKKATFTKFLSWQDGKIEPNQSSVKQIYNQIRALSVEPGVWINWQIANGPTKGGSASGGKSLIVKIIKARPMPELRIMNNELRMDLVELNKELVLICRDGALLLEQVQPQGKRIMTGKEFLNGYGKWLPA